MSTEIIYKSKYSLVCKLVGHPLPKTQDEEDYCRLVELQNDTWRPVITEMLTEYLNKINNAIR